MFLKRYFESWEQNIQQTYSCNLFVTFSCNRFLNSNFRKTTSKTIMFQLKCIPDLLCKCFAPFRQGTIKSPEAIWNLRLGVAAWPPVHLFRFIYQPSQSSAPYSHTKAWWYSASNDPGHHQPTASRIRPEKELLTIFPSDKSSHIFDTWQIY